MITKIIAEIENKNENFQDLQHRLLRIVADYKLCFVQRMQRALPLFCTLFQLEGAKIMHTLVIAPFYHQETREASYGIPINEHVFDIRRKFPHGAEIHPHAFYKYTVESEKIVKHFYYHALEKSLENQIVSELIFVLQEEKAVEDQAKKQRQMYQMLKTMVSILSEGFALERLGEEKDKLKTIISNTPAGIVSLNRCMYIETWNDFMEKITNISVNDIAQMDQFECKYEKSKGKILTPKKNLPLSDMLLKKTEGLISIHKIMTSAYQQDGQRIDVEGIRYNDGVYTASYIPRIHDNKKTGLDIIVIDKTYEYIDLGKTELFNDKYYQLFSKNLAERLDDTVGIEYQGIMLDLDHFKRVNDTYGHDCGDYVLREVGKIIKTTCRDLFGKYALPFRLGGEEFYVLIENCDSENALLLTKAIKEKIAGYNFKYDQYSFKCTISCGIASGDSLQPDITKCLADKALYKAKEQRNSIAVYSKKKKNSKKEINEDLKN